MQQELEVEQTLEPRLELLPLELEAQQELELPWLELLPLGLEVQQELERPPTLELEVQQKLEP